MTSIPPGVDEHDLAACRPERGSSAKGECHRTGYVDFGTSFATAAGWIRRIYPGRRPRVVDEHIQGSERLRVCGECIVGGQVHRPDPRAPVWRPPHRDDLRGVPRRIRSCVAASASAM